MKKITTLTFFLLYALTVVFAQAPLAFKYQAVARDASGNLLTKQEIGIRTSLLRGSENGATDYCELHNVLTDRYGTIEIRIGSGEVEKGSFSDIDWGAHSYWIKVEIDLKGDDNFKLMGASELYSVPYALFAKEAGRVSETAISTGGKNSNNDIG